MSTFNTAVEFVWGKSPTPPFTPGGWTPVQTGDFISALFILLFTLVAVASMGYLIYSRRKAGATFINYFKTAGETALTRLNKIAIGVCVASIVAILGVAAFMGVSKAIAYERVTADETIKVYVDPENQTLTSDPATIMNKSTSTAYIAATQIALTQEAQDILKDQTFNLKIDCPDLGTTLYNKAVPGVEDMMASQPFASGAKAMANLEITGLDFATAKLLIGVQVFNITFAEEKCFTVQYDGNGATSGTPPATQAKVPGKDIKLATSTSLGREGYTFDNKWNTKADGTGSSYELGATYSADADVTLYAQWKEIEPPGPDTYQVSFNASDGGTVDATAITAEVGTILIYSVQDNVLVLKNQADQSVVKTVTATPTQETNFIFKEWQLGGNKIWRPGSINSESTFTAVFEEYIPPKTINLTYKVLNTTDSHGHVALNGKPISEGNIVSETITVGEDSPAGATAIELADQPEHDFVFFFTSWTIDDDKYKDWSLNETKLTPEIIQELKLERDTVFIAHFVAPVAKYTETNSTMVFSCEETISGDDNFTYPVYNSHYDPEFKRRGDLSLLTFPAWCNYDGTQKAYPRTVKFLESFKQYKGLTSTSFWFNSYSFTTTDILANTDMKEWQEKANDLPNIINDPYQQRVLTTVSGLENIYTKNIIETAYMFAMSKHVSTASVLVTDSTPSKIRAIDYLQYLDFSQWNLNPIDEDGKPIFINMDSMFMNCDNLSKIDLPDETEGHYFGTYASNLNNFFYGCASIQTLDLKGDFGANANITHGMFQLCDSLREVKLNKNFGSSSTDISYMFFYCSTLQSIQFAPSFGAKATTTEGAFAYATALREVNFGTNPSIGSLKPYAAGMFYDCNSLRSIDLSSFSMDIDNSCSEMFYGCSSLEEFKISNNWNVNMSSASLHEPDSDRGWFKDNSTSQQFNTSSIPEFSGPGTFSLLSAKAVFDPDNSTFTFYYDCDTHAQEVSEGCSIYPVYGTTGFITGMINTNSIQNNASVRDLVIEDLFDKINYGRLGFGDERYLLSNLSLPSWYTIDYYNYKIVNNLQVKDKTTNVKVIFYSTFHECPLIQSTSCWFMADSNGYAPFVFNNGFSNIPVSYLRSTACMFGGLCFELFKDGEHWYTNSDQNIALGSSTMVYVSKYLDTYNTTLTELDLTTFNIVNPVAVDYGAICANCKALKKVKLPKAFNAPINEESETLQVSAVGNRPFITICSFAGAFYACENLETIHDLNKFNPFGSLEQTYRCTYDYYLVSRMFYGCKSIKSLDMSSFNTFRVWRNNSALGSDNSRVVCNDIFVGCDSLEEFTIGKEWYIPMGDVFHQNIEYANLPQFENENLYWVKDNENVSTNKIPFNSADPSKDSPDNSGKFTRDVGATKKYQQTVTIESNNPKMGTVSSNVYNFYQKVSLSNLENTISLKDTTISAVANDGFKFSFWEVNGTLFDKGSLLELNQSTKIVAHFTNEDYTAKAVYAKNNQQYDGDNTLTFYYDNIDHSLEGEVYEVAAYNFVDVNEKYVDLPSWYQRKYTAEGDLSGLRPVQNSEERYLPGEGIGIAIGMVNPISIFTHIICASEYNPWGTSSSLTLNAAEYGDVWRIQTLVEPKDVIFSESFKGYEELQSISMWFMADQFGTQSVENFYSPIAGNLKNPGFANMYTNNLRDVSYAFGGLFEPVQQHQHQQKQMLSANDVLMSAFDSHSNDDKESSEELWSKGTETYGTSLQTINLTGFDFTHVDNLQAMFANCISLKNIIFDNNFNTSYNRSCLAMFANCENLGPKIEDSVTNWNKLTTYNVESFNYMFYGCSGLEELDLSKMNTNKYLSNHNYSPYASYMFSECTRLYKVKVNSKYDISQPANIDGWGINFGASGLADCEGSVSWKNIEDTAFSKNASKMLPYDYDILSEHGELQSEDELHSGTFYRSQKYNEKTVNVVSNDEELGTVSDDHYGYINNVQVKLDNINDNAIYLDNRKITATPTDENSRFGYWQMEVDEKAPVILPSGFSQTYLATDNHTIKITAVFVSNETNAFVAFSVDSSRVGTFTFYYGEGTEEAASAFVPKDQTLVRVFDVKPNTSDYNLPSWYRKYQESWYQGDNHPVPKFVRDVEDNADTIYVNFDDSFAKYNELRSMSCWFMGALSHVNEAVLYNPFVLDTEEHFNGLEYINTYGISNVAYMFGGHEYFNEIHGSKHTEITLKNFDTEGYITNLGGLFANLPRLTTLNVDNCFEGMANVTSTAKMFYNTQSLEKSNLTWLNTSNVSNMTYMFGNTVDYMPAEADVTESFTLTLPPNFNITNKVTSLEGIFSGYANWKTLTIDFSKVNKQSVTENVTDTSYMFQNCYWASKISLDNGEPMLSSGWSAVTNTSHMFENCAKITTISKAEPANNSSVNDALLPITYATNLDYMFAGCSSLTYYSCSRKKELGVPTQILSMRYMFSDCPSLESVVFDSSYVWQANGLGMLGVFANDDGTGNSSLKHFTYDMDKWNYFEETNDSRYTFSNFGLSAYDNNNAATAWINKQMLNYGYTSSMPGKGKIEGPASNEEDDMQQFDRIEKFYNVKCPYAYLDYQPEVADTKPLLDGFIGIPAEGGYTLSYQITSKDPNSSNLIFTIQCNSATQNYAVSGYYETPEWWYQKLSDGESKKLGTGVSLPNESCNIWFPSIPNTPPRQTVDVLIDITSAFIFPIPTALINLVSMVNSWG